MHWLSYIACIVVTIAAIGTIAASAVHGLTNESGLSEEAEFAFTLSTWAFVWGIVALIALLVYVFDTWCCHRGGQTKPNFLCWVWGLFALFLVFPWLIVGQIILLRKWDDQSGTSATVNYAFAIFALIVSYLGVLGGVGLTSFVMFKTGLMRGIYSHKKETKI